jgi:hypothetical protein
MSIERLRIRVEQRRGHAREHRLVVRLREIHGGVVQRLSRMNRVGPDDIHRRRGGRRSLSARGRRTRALRGGEAAGQKTRRRHGGAHRAKRCRRLRAFGALGAKRGSHTIKSNDHQMPWHTARGGCRSNVGSLGVNCSAARNKKAPRLARRFSPCLRVISRVV